MQKKYKKIKHTPLKMIYKVKKIQKIQYTPYKKSYIAII